MTPRTWSSRAVMVLAGLTLATTTGWVAPVVDAQVPSTVPTVGTCSWLSDVSALSATNVWAIGGSCVQGSGDRALVLHWNGRAWSTVRTPAVSSYGTSLRQVLALSATNVWVVGSYARDSRQTQRTLVLHWNGTAFGVVPSPNRGTGGNWLADVAAVSPTDLWAVGGWQSPRYDAGGALAMHWNGSSWGLATMPTGSSFDLRGVSAVSSGDVWATGSRTATTGAVATLAMHWNGRAWGVVPMPNVGAGRNNNFLEDSLTAVGRNDVWASGSVNAGTESAPVFRSLVLHWSGSRWSVVASPNRGNSELYGGLAATSATDVWAVGSGASKTLVEHWNGRAWAIVASPNPGAWCNSLQGVDAVTPSLAFAVGSSCSTSTTSRTLVLRWNGSRWTAM